MVDAKRKKNESFESLLRRFNKRLQQSGKLILARKIKFYEKSKNKRAFKEYALYRKKSREKREFLKKIGLLKEDNLSKFKF